MKMVGGKPVSDNPELKSSACYPSRQTVYCLYGTGIVLVCKVLL